MSIVADVPNLDSDALSLADVAYQQLRDKLIMLEIKPGDPINDSVLAKELGMGRTPVREALKRLESDHLVISYARRGTFATVVDITELADISQIRELLEPLAAKRAAALAGPQTREHMRQMADTIAAIDLSQVDQRELMRYDIMVHRLIYRAAANPHLEDVLVRYDNLATRIWCLVLDKMPSVTGHITEHVRLLHAIADGEDERAAGLTAEHVTNFAQSIRHML